jgi:ABC-type branched-subunit amino acid transport system substrate-binding protein
MRSIKSSIRFGMAIVTILVFSYPTISLAQESKGKKWVTFGVIAPASGPVARIGSYIPRTVDLVVEEVNTKWNPPEGGIKIGGERYYLRYESYDDQADPAKSVAGFRKLVENYHVPFVIGPLGSPQGWAVMPESKRLKTIFTALSASDKTHRMGNPYMLSTIVPQEYMAPGLAKACIDRGWKKFAVCADVAEGWTAFSQLFRSEMERQGGVCVGYEVVDTKTILDFHPVMTNFKGKNPDVIFICAYPEPDGTMVLHAREVGYKGHFVTNHNFTDVAINIARIENSVGALVPAMYWDYCRLNPKEDKTGMVTYINKLWEAKYPGVNSHDLIAANWDPAVTIIKAMELANTTTDTLAIRRQFDNAVKAIPDKFAVPRTGVLPSGMITGVETFLCEVQGDGSFKKIDSFTAPTEKLREYKNPADAPLNQLP